MAKFKSSAKEGSFADNQFKVPDEVRKLENEANRRITGMNSHQAFLERNRQIFLQAQQLAQETSRNNNQTIFDVEKNQRQAFQNSRVERWEKALEQEQSKQKYKVDTLKLLAGFSKTALDVTTQIAQGNRDNQLKAINQIAVTNQFNYNDLVNAQSINNDISKAEWQRTQIAQQYLEEGKSQEFIDAMHQHLIQGGGYRNYVENSNILTFTARQHAQQLSDIAARTDLSPEAKRKAISARQAQLTSSLTIDGRIPGAKILESAYFPVIRRALNSSDDVINRQKREEVKEQTRVDQESIILKAHNDGGAPAVFDVINTFTKPDHMVNAISTLGQMVRNDLISLDEYREFGETPYEQDGQLRMLNGRAAELYYRQLSQFEAKQDKKYSDSIELEKLQVIAKAEELISSYAADGFTNDEADKVIEQLNEEFPFGSVPAQLVAKIEASTLEKQAVDDTVEMLEQEVENGTFSLERLQSSNLPAHTQGYKELYNIAVTQDNIRNSKEYKEFDKKFDSYVLGALKSLTGEQLVFLDAGVQSAQVQWLLDSRRADSRTTFLKLKANGSPITLAEYLAAEAKTIKDELGKDGAVVNRRITAFDKLAESAQSQRDNFRSNLTKLHNLERTTERANPANWAVALGGDDVLIKGVEEFDTKGSSPLLTSLGEMTKLTPYQVRERIAVYSDQVQSSPQAKTYNDFLEQSDGDFQWAMTSPNSTRYQRMRALETRINPGAQLPVRSVFQSGDRPRNTVSNALTYNGNEDLYISVGDVIQDAGFKVGEHSYYGTVGNHSQNGYHPHDEAFDITHQEGDYSASIEKTRRLKELIRSMDLFHEVIGPGDFEAGLWPDDSHAEHLHLGGLKRVPTEEELQMIKSFL